MALSPSILASIALAVAGVGLVAAAFVGATFGIARLVFGLVLITAAILTAGAGALLHHSAPPLEEET